MTDKKRKILIVISWLLVVICMGLIFALSHEEASQSSEKSSGIIAKISEIFSIELSQHFVRKSAHAFEYFTLCLLLNFSYGLTYRKFSPLLSIITAILYATTDEIHQFFILGRACQLRDVFVDSCGVLMAVLVCWAVVSLYKIKTDKREGKICQC